MLKKNLRVQREEAEGGGNTSNGVTIIDDYGHHPLEISTTINSIKEAYPGKDLTVIFQPHTFSRTKALLADFGNAFVKADNLILLLFLNQHVTLKAIRCCWRNM